MIRAVNDATLKQAGTIYQYLIALRDCFELNDDETLQIETNGDVSIINNSGGIFQKEVKHHFGDTVLSERSEEFWKTLANWYIDYDRIKKFSHYILSTTSKILDDSPFYNWNKIDINKKLMCLKQIGEIDKDKEKTFRSQYNKIFNENYDENKLLSILEKFTIESQKTSLKGISEEFSKYVGHIPDENRDPYIGALLGRILLKVKDPPHKWDLTRTEFEQILQCETAAYANKKTSPLPTEYIKDTVPTEKEKELFQKQFVQKIQEIKYDKQISNAINDYWKTDMTIVKYFQGNHMYLDSLDNYIEELTSKIGYAKDNSEIDADNVDNKRILDISKKLYNTVMQWDAKDFGSIINNQGFFQRGIIHNIVDETDFRWKVGEDKNEY